MPNSSVKKRIQGYAALILVLLMLTLLTRPIEHVQNAETKAQESELVFQDPAYAGNKGRLYTSGMDTLKLVSGDTATAQHQLLDLRVDIK